ncbi:MAG: hypothetical protein QXM22_03375 [Candidatus Bathyarchaeia archaeon]
MKEKRISREDEEDLWAASVLPPFLVLIFYLFFYFSQLKSNGIISFEEAFRYVMLAIMLFSAAVCGIYEIFSSFVVKRSFLFRVKRFLSRMLFAGILILCFLVIFSFLNLLLSSFLAIQYILSFTLLAFSSTLFALFQNSKFRELVRKLTKEDWAT